MIKYLFFTFFCGILLTFNSCKNSSNALDESEENHHEQHEHTPEGTKKALSPRTIAMGDIGDVHVHIDYSSPSVRDRTIWGGLVAYDKVWVTGAHRATSISFSKDIRINGQIVHAGTYAFFTIPGREEWIVILNKNYEQHLTDDYDQSEDILRLTIKPDSLQNHVEALTYMVEATGENMGNVSIAWDRIKITFKIQTV